MLRQARILRLLGAQPGVRVPGVLFSDAGSPPLFGMELVAGESYEPLLDAAEDPPEPGVVAIRARSAAEMLARMQLLDPQAIGLGSEPELPLREELDRWARLLETVDDDICPGHRNLYNALVSRLPDPVPPTLLHGDYRLANMLFDGADLAAIIDWEIWSVGDPRTDLAWLLMHTDPVHRFRNDRSVENVRAGSGMPSAAVLLAQYRAIRLDPVPDLEWFLAYCHYKTASTMSVFVKRNRRLPIPDPALVIAAKSLAGVIAKGQQILAGAGGRSVPH